MNMLIAAAQGQRIDYIYDAPVHDARIQSLALANSAALDFDSFVAGARGFFATRAKQDATVGSPFVAGDGDLVPMEFTAAMRITGKFRGTVYLSASRAMLTIMLMRMGSTDITVQSMRKALTDLAAAMAANARRNCGNDVLVWEPSVTMDRGSRLEMPSGVRPLVAPIHWRKFTAQLVLCLE